MIRDRVKRSNRLSGRGYPKMAHPHFIALPLLDVSDNTATTNLQRNRQYKKPICKPNHLDILSLYFTHEQRCRNIALVERKANHFEIFYR